MPAIPARVTLNFIAQDDRGFRARIKILSFIPDISVAAEQLHTAASQAGAVGTALQAATNAKIVSTGFGYDFDIAQEPSSETGTYQLVNQGAHLTFGDGTVLKEFLTIPAPVDSMFLTTTQDNLIVVDPTSTAITGLQTALAPFPSPAGGVVFSQFFGGQLRAQKPRRRRVTQGA